MNELSSLSNSITILQEEAKDPQSTLTRSGDDRIRMLNEMVAGIEVLQSRKTVMIVLPEDLGFLGRTLLYT